MEMGIGYKIGNGNWLQNWKWEWEGMEIDCMGMGGNENVKNHSRSSLLKNPYYNCLKSFKFINVDNTKKHVNSALLKKHVCAYLQAFSC